MFGTLLRGGVNTSVLLDFDATNRKWVLFALRRVASRVSENP